MIRNTYREYYTHLLREGVQVNPRGLETREVLNASYTFKPGEIIDRKGANIAIGFAELLQFLAGNFSPLVIQKVAPRARLDLFTLQSAYGPRSRHQWYRIIDELRRDSHSRRAIVRLSGQDEDEANLPCTSTLQFFIRENAVYATINMRSSDAVWGLPYDVTQFGGVTIALANVLAKRVGFVTVNMASAHIYLKTQVEPTEFHMHRTFRMPTFRVWDDYVEWAYAQQEKILRTAEWSNTSLKEMFMIEEVDNG